MSLQFRSRAGRCRPGRRPALTRVLVVAGLALAAVRAAADIPATAPDAAAPPDPFADVTACLRQTQPLQVIEAGRLPEPGRLCARTVETATGMRPVSLVDGWRLIFATPQGLPFVNLKVERSAAAHAVRDRSNVAAQMQAFSDRRAPGSPPMRTTLLPGAHLLALHHPTLDGPGPIGFVTLFVPSRDTIVTAYLLNQEPGQRAFATYAEYERLRDTVLLRLVDCTAPAPKP
jgi:hypothetical protein